MRGAALGTGVLALAVPLAWPAGAGGQHLSVASAGQVRSGVVRLADFVSGQSSPAPSVPVQQSGTAAGQKHLVPASQTRGDRHASGHAPGKGVGQLPSWPEPVPGGLKPKLFTSPGPARGFSAATSTVDQSGTSAESTLYKNADGSFTRRVYQSPVNYKTAAGTWAPIDRALVRGSGGRWREKANSAAVSFAAGGGDGSLAAVGNASGSQRASFSLLGAKNVRGVTSGSSETYRGILPGTDVTETATASGMSEALTLHSAAAGSSWTFPLALTGLTASLDGSEVDLRDGAGKVEWVIPPAVARSGPVDMNSASPQASSVLTYQLVTVNGGPALRMTLDKSWLDAPGRVFPVTVDPSFTMSVTGSNYVESDNGSAYTADNSGSEFLPSGTVTDSSGTYKAIDFLDLSTLKSYVSDEHVTGASLHMFDTWAYQCTYSEDVYAYQVTGSWHLSSSLTYPGPAYGTKDAQWSGVAPSSACSNTGGNPAQGGWLTLPFNSSGLSLLNGWTLGTTANFGFAITTSLSDEQMWKQFDSANDGAVPSGSTTVNLEPYLQMTFEADVAPQVNSQYPPNYYSATTLTPELIASGSDPDNWPDPLGYKFSVYDSSDKLVVSSGSTPVSSHWTVPVGSLSWGTTYYWTVQAYDGLDLSPAVAYQLSTPVPQPLITSQLSQNTSGAGFDPTSGNWTTSATDAHVSTMGPALEITRDYNSADPRVSGAFGAGWSSVLDMKVSPGQTGTDATGAETTDTEVVTYPDGEDVAFGLNSDGQTYSPPPGRYAELRTTSGGFTLTDKNDTVYTFTQSLGSGAYGITSIADAAGRTETFTWNGTDQITKITSASGRTLNLTWGWPSGASYSHVTSVMTDDATAGDSSTAQDWTYDYSGDDLTAACPPASTSACTAYTYTSGTDYPQAVLDSGPRSYWPLDDTSGSAATSSVLASEGTDNGTYEGVTLGASGGPLAGSSATVASFNGTSSYVALQPNLVSASSYQTISMWFKTTATNGVLFSYQKTPITTGSTTGNYVPTLYIGSDGRLNAEYINAATAPIQSAAAVNDGNWHQITLTAAGNTQTLYLDGVKVRTLSGTINVSEMANNYIGTGYVGGGWPDSEYSGSSTAKPEYFNGEIADVAFWSRPLTQNEAQTLWTAGSQSAALLTKETRPSGRVAAQVTYDPATSRVTSDTDAKGGTWQVQAPTVQGSSQIFVGSILSAHPKDYWRLNDLGATWAANQTDPCGCGSPATYYNVTEGVSGPGPFTDSTVASFNGASSYLGVPVADSASGGPGSVGVWFKTSGTDEVIYSEEGGPVTGSSPGPYNPVLYIGSDGKLNGEFWDGNTSVAVSKAAVNDGKWHYAVMAAGAGGQALYLDGALQGTVSGGPSSEAWTNVTAGAGFLGGAWPDIASTTVKSSWFNGDLAELAWYPYQLSGAQVASQWSAGQKATGDTPVQTDTVIDPGGNTLTWTYDLAHGGREISQTNAEGGTTTYGYNTAGFRSTVTDPDGYTTTTGYDVRGNMVSKTTCQDQANNKCSTSYYTYWPNDTAADPSPDPRNDLATTYSDGRSASSTDTTYQTKYGYDALGDLTTVTTPPVSGYPSGRVTTYAYTNGTTSDGGYQNVVPPAGLPYLKTTPGGAVTKTEYYADGDVARVTTPDGQQTVYTYDGLGRKASQTVYSTSFPSGLTTTYAYDANGRLVTQTDPPVTDRVTGAVHTRQVTTTYDADGDVTSQTVADLTGGDASRTVTKA